MKRLILTALLASSILMCCSCSVEENAPEIDGDHSYSIEYLDIEQGIYTDKISETLSLFPEYIQDEINEQELCIIVSDTTDILYEHCNNEQVSSMEERNILGCYINEYKNIYLIMGNLDYDSESIEPILCHEIGHFIWQRMLTVKEQDAFTEIYNSNEVNVFSEAISKAYCTERVEEFFSELIAVYYYVGDTSVLESWGIPNSVEFMKNLLNR